MTDEMPTTPTEANTITLLHEDGDLITVTPEDVAELLDRLHKASLVVELCSNIAPDGDDEKRYTNDEVRESYAIGMRHILHYILTGEAPNAD